MSWSVNAIGKPAAVKAALAASFEQAKKNCASVPHEADAVGIAEQLVNNQLDFLATINNPPTAVKVEASGSAYFSDNAQADTTVKRSGASNVKVEVQPVYGFIE